MKRTNSVGKLILPAACALFLAGFSFNAQAEKGVESLMRLAQPRPATLAKAKAPTPALHACPSCKDTISMKVDLGTKGPRHAVNRVVTHQCTACETKIVTEGIGKAKHNVAIHQCGLAKAAAICCTAK